MGGVIGFVQASNRINTYCEGSCDLRGLTPVTLGDFAPVTFRGLVPVTLGARSKGLGLGLELALNSLTSHPSKEGEWYFFFYFFFQGGGGGKIRMVS